MDDSSRRTSAEPAACAKARAPAAGIDGSPEFIRRRALRVPLVIAALCMTPWLPGCKGFGWKKTDNPVAMEPPQRKPIAGSVEQANKQPSAPVPHGPVQLDGSASGQDGVAVPNAPGIVGAPALAANPPSGGAGSAGARKRPGESGAVKTAESSGDDAAGSVVSADGRGETADLVQEEELPIDGWTAEATREARGKLKTPIEFEDNGTKVAEGEVAATVNGVPIFADDLLRQLPPDARAHLAQAQKLATPEQFRNMRQQYVKLLLKQQIEQEVVLQALKSKLKEQQIADFNKQLDQVFNTQFLPGVMKDLKVGTKEELELELQKKGSSIEAQRATFRNKEMVRQYVGTKAGVRDSIDRPDILAYYQEHRESYAIPAKVKWEQIQLKFAKHGGKEAARKKAEEISGRLKKGEKFADVAKECSDGPTASKGGQWAWMTHGNLADKEIDEALSERPVGKVGPPIETKDSLHIIRVLGRTEADYQPFEEVQEDIKGRLKNEISQKRVAELIQKLRDNATIEDFTDQL